ncbi:MAG: hypothetical protein GY801_36125 [bacterium]|nr:hypothetical protein [bacterium]
MAKTKDSITPGMQSVSPKIIISEGIVQNLPEIIGTIKEIYALHKKQSMFQQVLQSRLDELHINKENFKVLVQSLTELSTHAEADEDTKTMYREMIRALFEIFMSNMRSSQDFSNYLNNL